MSYHAFKDESGNTYGSFEAFHHSGADQHEDVGTMLDEDGEPYAAGWY